MKKRRNINRGLVLMLALVIGLVIMLTSFAVAHAAAQPDIRKSIEAVLEDYAQLLLLPTEYADSDNAEVPEAVLEAKKADANAVLRPHFGQANKTYATILRRVEEQLRAQANQEMRRLVALEYRLDSLHFSFEPGRAQVIFYYNQSVQYAGTNLQEGTNIQGQAAFAKNDGEWRLLYLYLPDPQTGQEMSMEGDRPFGLNLNSIIYD
ncbi:MAG: hypothetical protein LBC83_03940 [Oscillospiraceae bacterium]|jgi:hypothetical protein|nr:hypothetical protein [Oscillospiraceae bacterium]